MLVLFILIGLISFVGYQIQKQNEQKLYWLEQQVQTLEDKVFNDELDKAFKGEPNQMQQFLSRKARPF